jgi:alkanesulfonate monooxygenase SsuD/methylene tetrahydromethanopterin reductase-like flavin-dependent oxidoreductase (luciferase family)
MPRLSVGVNWQGNLDRERFFDGVRAADDGGVDSVWVAEAWGQDAFTTMTQIVDRTSRIQVGSAIVNVFSRTPAALAQHFATLDEISGGRIIIGLGTSGAQVIEHFHGIPFEKPLRRLREYVEIINMLIAGEPLNYDGEIFKLGRGFTLRFETFRKHIPIYLATMNPASVRQTARLADGWLPIWTPLEKVAEEVKLFRETAAAAGRDPNTLTVRSPGGITITKNVERAKAGVAGGLAFYVSRMGVFYYRHMSRLGYADETAAIKRAWDEGGSKAGTTAVPEALQQQVGFVTNSVEAARERIAEQEAAGINLHQISVDAESPAEVQKVYERLAT